MFSHLQDFFRQAQSRAVGLIFSCSGFLFGNWVPQIPYIKEKFGFDDGQLGLLLLTMPLGATIANPVSTVLLYKFAMRWLTLFAAFILPICFILPVFAPNIAFLCLGLFFAGSFLSILNIAINTCATTVEQEHNINILSSCHGMWSLGGAFGSLIGSTLIGSGMKSSLEVCFVASFIILLVFSLRKNILKIQEEKPQQETSTSKFIMPNKMILGMIAISICINITEGTMADWTAVYMRDIVQANAQFLGWGFAFYAVCMASGRFLGDGLIPRFGATNILKYGGLTAATGLAIVIVFPSTLPTILGFAMVGIGVSCGAPILYGSAARIPNMAKGAGLATMNTFSITGFLVGPAIIGFVSKASSLPIAFAFVAFLGLLWAFLVGRTKIY